MDGQNRSQAARWAIRIVGLLAVLSPLGRADAQAAPAAGRSASASAGAGSAVSGPARGGLRAFRPHGAIEFGVGVLVLPNAEVCADTRCERGDVSLGVEARPLFHLSEGWALGAGVTLGLTPTLPPQRSTVFSRDHSRRYFQAEAVARYFFFQQGAVRAWAGAAAGLVVVSDNFRGGGGVGEFSPVGPSSASLASEGWTLGLATGADLDLTPAFAVGLGLRAASWFLPNASRSTPLGDTTSLLGRTTMLSAVFTVSYRAAGRYRPQ